MKEKLTFKDIWESPFVLDDMSGYIFSSNGEIIMSPTIDNIEDFNIQLIVNKLNGNKDIKLEIEFKYESSLGEIKCYDNSFYEIRGWGALTSPNCYNLSEEAAKEIQDEFGKWIVEILNK